MPERLFRRLVQRLRADALNAGELPTDGDLLDRYLRGRDEAAFELLVRRHGALVLGVCRRTLQDTHAAEDAFQATFLVLARKARSVRQTTVAGWLYRVALRVAVRARHGALRRGLREQPLAHEPAAAEPDRLAGIELRAVLDDELRRLPERFRLPVLLCYVEGQTTEQAARLLGCPRGTVLSRLATARKRLRGRLLRRGVGVPAVALTAALAEPAWPAAVPAVLAAATVRGAFSLSEAPTRAAHLAQGVMNAMFLSKVKFALGIGLVLGALALAGSRVVFDMPARGQDVPREGVAQKAERPLVDRQVDVQAQLDRARDELSRREEALNKSEERQSTALIDARLKLLELEEQLRALERRQEVELAELQRRRVQPDPVTSAEHAELQKGIDSLTSGLYRMRDRGVAKDDKTVQSVETQLRQYREKLLDGYARLETQRREARAEATERERGYSQERIRYRKEILAAEEHIRLLERRAMRETERLQAALDAASARVRQLEGLTPAAAPTGRSNAEWQRRLDELIREVAELRRELKRQREGK
jgi:RNA polymerase sigma factor (sigma-70 family)